MKIVARLITVSTSVNKEMWVKLSEVSGVELADSQPVPMNRNIRVRWVSDSLLMIQANLVRRIKEPMAMASPTTS